MGDLEVCLEALGNEATLWDEESEVGTSVKEAAEGLWITRIQAGMFQTIVDSNNQVCGFVSEAGRLAAQEMKAVATALRENAREYEISEDTAASVPTGY